MAKLPQPIGVGTMLTDIAQGLGAAARLVVEQSKSEVGAIAVKGARVDVEFEMASRATSDAAGARLGVRTFSFGFGVNREAVEERRINRGRIEIEIAAVPLVATPAAPEVDKPSDADPQTVDAATRMKKAIAVLRKRLDATDVAPRLRSTIENALDRIDAFAAAGDLAAATAALLELQPFFEQPPGDGDGDGD